VPIGRWIALVPWARMLSWLEHTYTKR